MKVTINFEKLPLWINAVQTTKLLKAAKVKKLRETNSLICTTIDGHYHYLLVDVLKHAGVTDFVFNADTVNITDSVVASEEPLISEDFVESPESPVCAADMKTTTCDFDIEPSEAQQKEIEEVTEAYEEEALATIEPGNITTGVAEATTKYPNNFYYVDMFTYQSPILPENVSFPIFRVNSPGQVKSYVHKLLGKVVDIQMYNASLRPSDPAYENFPKMRVIIESISKPGHFLVLQLRYDKFFDALFADLICEWVMNQTLATAGTLSIEEDTTAPRPGMKFSIEHGEWIDSISTAHLRLSQPPISLIHSKAKAAIDTLKDQGSFNRCITPKLDNNFVSSLRSKDLNVLDNEF